MFPRPYQSRYFIFFDVCNSYRLLSNSYWLHITNSLLVGRLFWNYWLIGVIEISLYRINLRFPRSKTSMAKSKCPSVVTPMMFVTPSIWSMATWQVIAPSDPRVTTMVEAVSALTLEVKARLGFGLCFLYINSALMHSANLRCDTWITWLQV